MLERRQTAAAPRTTHSFPAHCLTLDTALGVVVTNLDVLLAKTFLLQKKSDTKKQKVLALSGIEPETCRRRDHEDLQSVALPAELKSRL
jgi:hypothetical protein